MNDLFYLLGKKLILERNTCWPIGRQTRKFIFDNVNYKTTSIETGIGYSTFIFAANKSNHTVIFPDESVEFKIRNYAKENNIDLEKVNFIVGKSEYVLPTIKHPINFALVDGCHKFPNAIVDFFYLNDLLEVNGIIVIDDLKIKSVRLLYNFLIVSSKWKLIKMLDNDRCCVFKKIKNDKNDWHRTQEFNQNDEDRLVFNSIKI